MYYELVSKFTPIILATLLGLLCSNLVNIIIYRLPIMLTTSQTYYSYIILKILPNIFSNSKFTSLLTPLPSCTKCNHQLRLIDNIPVLSYLLLKGRCHFCKHKIATRYLIVEILSGVLCGLCAYKFDANLSIFFACVFCLSMLAAAMIDLEHMILPDEINLSGIWLGLLLSLTSIFTNSPDAIVGAVLGYLSLWCIFWIFYALTGKYGIGGGDFKLFALFGAWFGWQSLHFIITVAAFSGSIVGLYLIIFKKLKVSKPIPFGPFLILSAYIYLFYWM
jgi:leader peptidase (prepilin peptidase)/N-methyltransferase